jgi:AcrR family transcriptional regulator
MSASDDGSVRRRSRREERKEETRAELIAAAKTVFARRGFAGASLEQIAAEAGYSTGAIYWHFSGKDDLFLAVFEEYATTRVREWEDIREHATGDFPQRARMYADQWMERLGRDPELMVLALEFLVHSWRNPPVRQAFADRTESGRMALAGILEQAADQQGVVLPMSPQEIASALRELGTGLGLAKLADPSAIPDRLFGDFVELFFTMLLDHERHPDRAQSTDRP